MYKIKPISIKLPPIILIVLSCKSIKYLKKSLNDFGEINGKRPSSINIKAKTINISSIISIIFFLLGY